MLKESRQSTHLCDGLLRAVVVERDDEWEVSVTSKLSVGLHSGVRDLERSTLQTE